MSSPKISGVLRSRPAKGFFMFLNNMKRTPQVPTNFHLPSPVAGLSYPSKGSYVENGLSSPLEAEDDARKCRLVTNLLI
jgi:hypothetical protein